MSYDLRTEPWIPWRLSSGGVVWGPLATLFHHLGKDLGSPADAPDPVVALAVPRPDFDGALQEFLIGLLTVALKPSDESQWLRTWNSPPSPSEFTAALDALPPAFELDGEGARFFQDFSAAEMARAEPTPIEQLLINAPGEQTVKLGKALFIKSSQVQRMSYPTAAMALLTMQTYSPSGGQGHRTSLRGGGPLTTLVDPRQRPELGDQGSGQSLFRKLWANVETAKQWELRTNRTSENSRPSEIFPWLAPTRTSGKQGGTVTTPDDVHPLQAYFGLPRRIRLETSGPGRCDITGEEADRTVVGFRMLNYGVQYQAWKHPLSPYYRTKTDPELLPMHGQPGGVGWRDWLSLTMQSHDGGLREPAQAVVAFHERASKTGNGSPRLHVFGYDLDNMKARGWTDATLPLFETGDEHHRMLLADTARRLTEGTSIAASALLSSIERALFQRPEDAPGDLSQVKTELWSATESAFYDAMSHLVATASTIDDAEALRARFAGTIATETTRVFDRWCGDPGSNPTAIRRMVSARFNLVMTLRGYSKLGDKLFVELGIPAPADGRARRAAKPRARKEATT